MKLGTFILVALGAAGQAFAFDEALLNDLPTKKSGFLWGAANAAFQVEGAPAESDWKRWTLSPGKVADGTNAEVATDFWNRYDEDFKWAQDMGANAFRISIAWERIEPKPGVWDEEAFKHYEKILVSMRQHGMEPVVTLQHFALPGWLADEGGLTAKDFSVRFAEYAVKTVARFSAAPADVKLWMTFNEPMVMVDAGYLSGEWPPGRSVDMQGAMEAAANIARAHIEAVRRIRALKNPNVKLSIAKHWRVFEGIPGQLLGGSEAHIADWAFNRQIMNAITTGKLFFWMPGSGIVRETIPLPENRPTIDFLAINYYGRTQVGASLKAPFIVQQEGPGPKSDIGWEMYPEGLYRALIDVKQYKVPILISENGVADKDDKFRANFIREHLAYMNKAIKEGVPVMGYLHWSLTDNFEWARGEASKFGLIEIDYKTQKRTPRPSYTAYKNLIH